MYLEEPFKTVTEQYKEAYNRRVQGDNLNTYIGIYWYYSEPLNQYITTKDNYTLSKFQHSKVLFKNKTDAKKFQKYKRELYRLTNIYIQKCIDDSINKLENVGINKDIINLWKQEFWYK